MKKPGFCFESQASGQLNGGVNPLSKNADDAVAFSFRAIPHA